MSEYSICRKVAGGTGGTINLGGIAKSLKIEGEEHIRYARVLFILYKTFNSISTYTASTMQSRIAVRKTRDGRARNATSVLNARLCYGFGMSNGMPLTFHLFGILLTDDGPELIHPFASAIDSPLKPPKEIVRVSTVISPAS